jgi:HSP20 family protein
MAQMQGNGNRTQGTQPQGNQPQGSNQMTRRSGSEQGSAMARPMNRSRTMSPFAAFRSLSPLMSSSPFGMVRRVFDDMERMMESMIPDMDEMGPEMGGMALDFVPRVDVTRRNENIVVHVDLPGLSPQEVKVEATEDGLIIEGERHHESERTEGDVWQSERSYGRFYRMVPLPEGADLDSVQARFENGVLEIQVKAPQGRGGRRQIQIQGGSMQGGQPEQSGKPREKA